MRISKIAAITASVNEGRWVGHLLNMDEDVALKVRIPSNPIVARIMQEARTAATEEEWKDPEFQRALDIKLMAEGILVDWAGIEDENGKPIRFSPEAAVKLLVDPQYQSFQQACNYASGVVADRGAASLEDALKNSRPASDGTSSGATASSTSKRSAKKAGRSRGATSKSRKRTRA